ncbi:protein of unknown function [Magnetospirillum sp. XM-1]|nr:protein of unknown function [Magnetospirillum sp. XM-1]
MQDDQMPHLGIIRGQGEGGHQDRSAAQTLHREDVALPGRRRTGQLRGPVGGTLQQTAVAQAQPQRQQPLILGDVPEHVADLALGLGGDQALDRFRDGVEHQLRAHFHVDPEPALHQRAHQRRRPPGNAAQNHHEGEGEADCHWHGPSPMTALDGTRQKGRPVSGVGGSNGLGRAGEEARPRSQFNVFDEADWMRKLWRQNGPGETSDLGAPAATRSPCVEAAADLLDSGATDTRHHHHCFQWVRACDFADYASSDRGPCPVPP